VHWGAQAAVRHPSVAVCLWNQMAASGAEALNTLGADPEDVEEEDYDVDEDVCPEDDRDVSNQGNDAGAASAVFTGCGSPGPTTTGFRGGLLRGPAQANTAHVGNATSAGIIQGILSAINGPAPPRTACANSSGGGGAVDGGNDKASDTTAGTAGGPSHTGGNCGLPSGLKLGGGTDGMAGKAGPRVGQGPTGSASTSGAPTADPAAATGTGGDEDGSSAVPTSDESLGALFGSLEQSLDFSDDAVRAMFGDAGSRSNAWQLPSMHDEPQVLPMPPSRSTAAGIRSPAGTKAPPARPKRAGTPIPRQTPVAMKRARPSGYAGGDQAFGVVSTADDYGGGDGGAMASGTPAVAVDDMVLQGIRRRQDDVVSAVSRLEGVLQHGRQQSGKIYEGMLSVHTDLRAVWQSVASYRDEVQEIHTQLAQMTSQLSTLATMVQQLQPAPRAPVAVMGRVNPPPKATAVNGMGGMGSLPSWAAPSPSLGLPPQVASTQPLARAAGQHRVFPNQQQPQQPQVHRQTKVASVAPSDWRAAHCAAPVPKAPQQYAEFADMVLPLSSSLSGKLDANGYDGAGRH
jgi:hypothetical protein